MKYLGDTVVKDTASLEVYECECGFHIGIDSSYLEQVAAVTFRCPSCNELMIFPCSDDCPCK